MKYICSICGFIYDEAEQAVPFDQLPDDWTCPLCGSPKYLFEPYEDDSSTDDSHEKSMQTDETEKSSVKYVCPICGYVYDEAEQDIPFDQLPDDWTCPLCGAPKALFTKQENESETEKENKPESGKKENKTNNIKTVISDSDYDSDDDLVLLSAGELSALFSNLARGCEKQYQEEAMKCFNQIAGYFEEVTEEETDLDIQHIADLIKDDLDNQYKELISAAAEVNDRGTLRITTWGEKVTRMTAALVDRYLKEGDGFLENTGLYVCTVCGFMYVGDNPPDICPVCKVPGWKFEKIDGRGF